MDLYKLVYNIIQWNNYVYTSHTTYMYTTSTPYTTYIWPTTLHDICSGIYNIDVAFIIWLYHFSYGCIMYQMSVSFIMWLYHFSYGCIIYHMAVSFIIWLCHLSYGCVIYHIAVSFIIWLCNLSYSSGSLTYIYGVIDLYNARDD